ncbi:hypothetical protein [Nocardia sp. CY41]|uniref:hypothetical protein n=1 Tax=Nocardia sp. CY41 TaxID=2608686 RepID=UPI00135C450A|nr:hypothetical protein [Nocardia sp. CY41]
MSIDNAFNDDDSVTGRILTTSAHLMLYGIAITIATRTCYYLGIEHWTIRVVGFLASLLYLAGVLHNSLTRLCVRCMSEVPADAGARAQCEKPVLWLNHRLSGRMGILILVAIGIEVLVRGFGLPGQVVSLPFDLLAVLYMYSVWLHHRLRPWCPYCRRWDDGGGITEPSPVPVVEATR